MCQQIGWIPQVGESRSQLRGDEKRGCIGLCGIHHPGDIDGASQSFRQRHCCEGASEGAVDACTQLPAWGAAGTGLMTLSAEAPPTPAPCSTAAGKKEKSTITLRIQWIPYQELSK